MEIIYDLEKELERLQKNFRIRLSIKIQQASVKIKHVDVVEEVSIADQIDKLKGVRKWLRLFNIFGK